MHLCIKEPLANDDTNLFDAGWKSSLKSMLIDNELVRAPLKRPVTMITLQDEQRICVEKTNMRGFCSSGSITNSHIFNRWNGKKIYVNINFIKTAEDFALAEIILRDKKTNYERSYCFIVEEDENIDIENL